MIATIITLVSVLIGIIIGSVSIVILDRFFMKKYGFPSLAIVIARCKKSKWFKWLAFNVWGNDDWYYDIINKQGGKL
jgi:ABC-type dipeptide/oligopeptide/nickel transport system permease subunit